MHFFKGISESQCWQYISFVYMTLRCVRKVGSILPNFWGSHAWPQSLWWVWHHCVYVTE